MSKRSDQLRGKVAIVTGGASGIGRALSEELASRGAEVVLADRQVELAREVAGGIDDRYGRGRATAVELDVRDLAAWKKVVEDTVRRSRRIDYLFNNAGIAIGAEVSESTAEEFDDVYDVNLRGVTYGVLAVYPVMMAQASGHIVSTASVAGLVPAPGTVSYTATKHAVVALSKSLRIEAAAHGVRVSALCPGAIRTPILTGGRFGKIKLRGATDASVMRQWEKTRPMAPEAFAAKALDRVLANEAIIVVPSFWKALWYLDRISPTLSMAVGAWVRRKVREDIDRDAEAAARAGGTAATESRIKANGHGVARA
jgi:NAD(P)-dependent dehydrogenase (short-subunit alcohol dehydrogenase family)